MTSNKSITVLDYGLGNLRSVGNALRAIGANVTVSGEFTCIEKSDGLIIPGVGAFPHGMLSLAQRNLIPIIHNYITSGRPVLGICLGMQMLFDHGAEFSLTKGLGIIRGGVERISVSAVEGRLPHIAWSTVNAAHIAEETLFRGLNKSERRFYFVHSYAAAGVDKENILATVKYFDKELVAAVYSNNVWATQFHPEKSGPSGLRLLSNFVDKC